MSILTEFSMFPISGESREGSSVSRYVSRIIDVIDRSGVPYQLTPMGTVLETQTLREALEIIALAYEQLEEDCERVYSTVKLDIRKGKGERLRTKIESVERHLGRDVAK